MGNPSLNIIDLRPKLSPKHKSRNSSFHKKWLFWLVPIALIVITLISFSIIKISRIEKEYSNIINLLPEIGNDLNTFHWDDAILKIDSLKASFSTVNFLDKKLETLVKYIPIVGQKKEISLYYNLKNLAQTLSQLSEGKVFDLDGQVNSTWKDLYPQLLSEVDDIILLNKSPELIISMKEWQDSFIKLNTINKLFGNLQPINYLFILNDINQARPLGGEVAGVITTSVSNWQIKYWRAYNASSLDNQISSKIIPPKELQLINTNWGLRQSNWFGDLNLFAQSFTTLWKQSGAGALFDPDALVIFNVKDVEPLNGYLGNIALEHQTVTNLNDYLENSLKSYRLSSGPLAEDYLSFINDSLPQNLKNLQGKEWLSILQAYVSSGSGIGSNNVYFLPWKQANLAKDLNPTEDTPTFMFTHSDLNTPIANLSSLNLKTSAKVTLNKVAEGYNMEWVISLTNQNQNSFVDFIRLYVPKNISISSVSGLDKYLIPSDPINYTVKKFSLDPLIENWEKQKNCTNQNNYCLLQEGDKTVLSGWSKIKAGQTKIIKVQLFLPSSVNEFKIIPQIGTNFYLQLKGSDILSSEEILSYLEKSILLNKDLLIRLNHD